MLPCAGGGWMGPSDAVGVAAALLSRRRCPGSRGTVRGVVSCPASAVALGVQGGWARGRRPPPCRGLEGCRAGAPRTGRGTVALLLGTGTHAAAASGPTACVRGCARGSAWSSSRRRPAEQSEPLECEADVGPWVPVPFHRGRVAFGQQGHPVCWCCAPGPRPRACALDRRVASPQACTTSGVRPASRAGKRGLCAAQSSRGRREGRTWHPRGTRAGPPGGQLPPVPFCGAAARLRPRDQARGSRCACAVKS